MELNEVVAANVRRVREERGLSVAELAELLAVGKHRVYDYERPRKGEKQREFTLWDLFSLCVVLETTLFELLLPPEGVEVDGVSSEDWMVRGARAAGLHETAEDLDSVAHRGDRRNIGRILFGVDGSKLDSTALETLVAMGRKEQERREQIIRGLTAEMWQRIKEMDI